MCEISLQGDPSVFGGFDPEDIQDSASVMSSDGRLRKPRIQFPPHIFLPKVMALSVPAYEFFDKMSVVLIVTLSKSIGCISIWNSIPLWRNLYTGRNDSPRSNPKLMPIMLFTNRERVF